MLRTPTSFSRQVLLALLAVVGCEGKSSDTPMVKKLVLVNTFNSTRRIIQPSNHICISRTEIDHSSLTLIIGRADVVQTISQLACRDGSETARSTDSHWRQRVGDFVEGGRRCDPTSRSHKFYEGSRQS